MDNDDPEMFAKLQKGRLYPKLMPQLRQLKSTGGSQSLLRCYCLFLVKITH